MVIFQVPQADNSMGLSLGNLMQLAMQSRNSQATADSAQQTAMTRYATQNALANTRQKNYLSRQQNANDIARDWQADQSVATMQGAQALFPGSGIEKLTPEIARFMTPEAVKNFTNNLTVSMPRNIISGTNTANTVAPNVSASMLPAVTGAIDKGVSNIAGYNQQNSTYAPADPAMTASGNYQPVPQAAPPTLPGPTYANTPGSAPVVSPTAQPILGGQVPPGYAPVSAADQAKNESSPIMQQRGIDNANRANTTDNLTKAATLDKIVGQKQLLGLDGQPMRYATGELIPNSLPVDAATRQYAALLKQTTNPASSAKAQDDIAKWHGDVASTVTGLTQAAGTFENIRREMNKDPKMAGTVGAALKGVKAQYSTEYARFEEAARKDPSHAQDYANRLNENLQRGITANFGALASNPDTAELVSSLGMVTNLMTLELARAVQGVGVVSNLDAMAIKGSLGSAYDSPFTMFNRQSKVFSFLSNRVAPKVYATRDPFYINEFNKIYGANVGTNYDPRGQIYGGIGNQNPQSTMQAVTGGSTTGATSQPSSQRATSLRERLKNL